MRQKRTSEAAGRCLLRRVVVHTDAGQTWHVDIRVKTFVLEAGEPARFLRMEPRSAGSEVEHDRNRRVPAAAESVIQALTSPLRSVWCSRTGEEHVATSLVPEDRSGSPRRTQIGSSTAHTGCQTWRALDRHPKVGLDADQSPCRDQPPRQVCLFQGRWELCSQ